MDKSTETLDLLQNSAEAILDEVATLREEHAALIRDRDRALELQRLRGDIRRAQATLDEERIPARDRNTGRQDRWTRSHMVVISGKLPNGEAREFVRACDLAGVSPYSVLNAAARAFAAKHRKGGDIS